MNRQGIRGKYENYGIAAVTILVNIAVLSIFFDFYYDLNDDFFMRDIMSGAYTGTPDGHNVQTLYALGAFISLFYKLCRPLPWYGLFLLVCQMGSLYAVGARLLQFGRSLSAKAGCMGLFTLFLWGVILPHMAALHYTFISALMASAALFLFLTTPRGLSERRFIIWNIPSILLVILAYQLRTEMLLLLFPFICLAGLFRWAEEEKFFQKENYIKYGVVLACIVCGMLVSSLIDLAAYGSGEWKRFLLFFDKRTEVYDYHLEMLTGGEYEEYLRSIGLNDAQQELLSNYNFGLDESIDAELMSEIAARASADTDYAAAVPKAVRYYIYRTLHGEDAPYNGLVIALCFCIMLSGVFAAFADRRGGEGVDGHGGGNKGIVRGRWIFLWELALLGIVRTALWMFILIRGRYPERITHSLYVAETALLLGMLCIQFLKPGRLCFQDGNGERPGTGRRAAMAVFALTGFFCLYHVPYSVGKAMTEKESREISHADCMEIARYCREHPDHFYFKDVYSTVGYSQKVFQDVDNSLTNHDIMGGWLCKSPLYDEKLAQFGITTMEEGLIDRDDVYFIISKESDTGWLPAYYAGKGMPASVEEADSIGELYTVYRVKRISEPAKDRAAEGESKE
ncbi:MAG: hypothetical protein NC341_04425 [Blautia sp.]|nr:hypothetical protein [Blautia sp.]MCM1200882.1 hypothetical protein [Bacteroides fragilis]